MNSALCTALCESSMPSAPPTATIAQTQKTIGLAGVAGGLGEEQERAHAVTSSSVCGPVQVPSLRASASADCTATAPVTLPR